MKRRKWWKIFRFRVLVFVLTQASSKNTIFFSMKQKEKEKEKKNCFFEKTWIHWAFGFNWSSTCFIVSTVLSSKAPVGIKNLDCFGVTSKGKRQRKRPKVQISMWVKGRKGEETTWKALIFSDSSSHCANGSPVNGKPILEKREICSVKYFWRWVKTCGVILPSSCSEGHREVLPSSASWDRSFCRGLCSSRDLSELDSSKLKNFWNFCFENWHWWMDLVLKNFSEALFR